jgi:hypothetical protein
MAVDLNLKIVAEKNSVQILLIQSRAKEKKRIRAIYARASSEERQKLDYLWLRGSHFAGNLWNKFSKIETTDENLEISAQYLCEYRILLAEIEQRPNHEQ